MNSELKKFYDLIEDIEVGMMTTRRTDGHLRSRAMANQKRADGADLWFVTSTATAKVRDLEYDPHVNVSYFKPGTMEWISVSGTVELSTNRQTIKELYASDWRMWFPDEGDPRHGTPEDPRLILIGVQIHAAEFLEMNKSKPVVLYELAKGWLTGTEPDLGEMHQLTEPRRPSQ